MQHWKFKEDNEWEGETWTVFFTADDSLTPKLEELSRLFSDDEEKIYKLVKRDELPKEEKLDSSGDYFPLKQICEIKEEVIDPAIEYMKLWNSGGTGDDPLYKLGLFKTA